VLLADDHTLFREGMAGLLASYGALEVVGQTANDDGAVALARETKPDVVIMQVQMPPEKAKRALDQMRALSPAPKVVIVTMFEDPRLMRELLRLGASAYLLKSASSRQLIGAVRAAVFDPRGENVVVGMPRSALTESDGLVRRALRPPARDPAPRVARSLQPPDIHAPPHHGGHRQASPRRHLQKMEVNSRGEAARKALQEEWITIRDVTEGYEEAEA
jgi:DNA-binding NarL/FixJ family response regulator